MKNATPVLRPVEGHLRAICCECGEVRLMKAGYRGRNKNHMAEDQSPKRWRCVVDLPCTNCGELRRHAWLRDHDEYADWVEVRDHLGSLGRDGVGAYALLAWQDRIRAEMRDRFRATQSRMSQEGALPHTDV